MPSKSIKIDTSSQSSTLRKLWIQLRFWKPRDKRRLWIKIHCLHFEFETNANSRHHIRASRRSIREALSRPSSETGKKKQATAENRLKMHFSLKLTNCRDQRTVQLINVEGKQFWLPYLQRKTKSLAEPRLKLAFVGWTSQDADLEFEIISLIFEIILSPVEKKICDNSLVGESYFLKHVDVDVVGDESPPDANFCQKKPSLLPIWLLALDCCALTQNFGKRGTVREVRGPRMSWHCKLMRKTFRHPLFWPNLFIRIPCI